MTDELTAKQHGILATLEAVAVMRAKLLLLTPPNADAATKEALGKNDDAVLAELQRARKAHIPEPLIEEVGLRANARALKAVEQQRLEAERYAAGVTADAAPQKPKKMTPKKTWAAQNPKVPLPTDDPFRDVMKASRALDAMEAKGQNHGAEYQAASSRFSEEVARAVEAGYTHEAIMAVIRNEMETKRSR